jgi:hypothetical protein
LIPLIEDENAAFTGEGIRTQGDTQGVINPDCKQEVVNGKD